MSSNPMIIELKVRNHPGVMSHITGLFARRAFNLEGILCGPAEGKPHHVIYLLVEKDESLDQILKNLSKLYDVLEVSICNDGNTDIFNNIGELVKKTEQA